MEIIDVLLAVLAIAGIVLCVYLTITLKRFIDSLNVIKSDLHNLVDEIIPVIQNLNSITEHVINVSSTAEKQVMDINNRIEEVKKRIFSFRKILSKENTETQIVTLLNNLRAVVKGLSAFVKKI